MPQVQPGRIVHYVFPEGARNAGEVRAAMLVRVWQPKLDGPYPGMSNLVVFLDGPNDRSNPNGTWAGETVLWVGSAHYDESGAPGTWHWLPRD